MVKICKAQFNPYVIESRLDEEIIDAIVSCLKKGNYFDAKKLIASGVGRHRKINGKDKFKFIGTNLIMEFYLNYLCEKFNIENKPEIRSFNWAMNTQK